MKETDIEKELRQKTLEGSEMAGAMDAPEVLQLGKMFLCLLHAKKVLDIGKPIRKKRVVFDISKQFPNSYV